MNTKSHQHKHLPGCHCGLKEQLKKFRAGKLGVLGGILIVGHLLFHVAECLVIPAIIIAFGGNAAETMETNIVNPSEISLEDSLSRQDILEVGIYQVVSAYQHAE